VTAARLLTIGYEGRSAQQLLDDLAHAGATVVVDVRQTPASRMAGMSKRRLSDALVAAGISYVHMPELGNPRENREALRIGGPAARARYLDRLYTPEGEAAVRRVIDLASAGTAVLLCLEREPDNCHRRIVADEARRIQPGLEVVDL